MKEKIIRLNKLVHNELGDYKLDPYVVTGFADGEGCFHVSVTQNKNYNLGWEVRPSFIITQHVGDKTILEEIKNYLGVGHVTLQGPNTLQFRIQSLKEFETVIIHFDKFPLNTQKRSDFKLLKMVILKMKRKDHLTDEGLIKIVAMKASMNLGLSENLKLAKNPPPTGGGFVKF